MILPVAKYPPLPLQPMLFLLLISFLSTSFSFVLIPQNANDKSQQSVRGLPLHSTAAPLATELPDSLADAAVRAAEATHSLWQATGSGTRCRVDFDTTVGDETYTLLKASTEFMQEFVSALCYAMIPGAQEQKQKEVMAVVEAQAELNAIQNDATPNEDREEELIQILQSQGRVEKWTGPIARIYFPDEGNAALARRDWSDVPSCVDFSSCGGVQVQDVSKDQIMFFFCPKASEATAVEEILEKTEISDTVQLVVFVNPQLVDMGVTGFGMAGRRLRERLVDSLVNTYYLRTLPWGALTRKWPDAFSVYQEDAIQPGGYKLIKIMDRLPSNPEVEDIYDIANGNMKEKQSGGLLDQFGDFVNGMMRL